MKVFPLPFFKSLRPIGLIFLAILFIATPLYSNVNRGNDPDDDKEQNSGENDECPEDGSGNDCVSFGFYFPILPHEPDLGVQQFRIVRHEPTPALFTPQALDYASIALTYVAEVVAEEDLPSGVSHRFEITNQKNVAMPFEVLSGQSIGKSVDEFANRNLRVRLLDANKDPVTEDPAFYRLLMGDGRVVDYPVGKGLTPVWYRTAKGRELDLSALIGDDVHLALEAGFLRQIKSVAGLADIVTIDDYGYEIRLYTPEDAGSLSGDLYVPTGSPYRVIQVENPTGDVNQHDTVRITDSHGSYSNTSTWAYVPAAEDWELTEGEGDALRTEQIVITEDPVTGHEIKTTELRDADDQLISSVRKVIEGLPWNKAVIEEIQDPDDLVLTKTFEYYTNSSEKGRYSKERLITEPDGSWIRYDYDAEGRKIEEVTPWQDSPSTSSASLAKVKTFDYTAVDPNDTPDDFDTRPRTVIEETLGDETARTYYAYYTDGSTGEFTEVEERATVQGAAYGAATSLRTVRIYYPASASAVEAGRLKSVQRPDGTVETFDYTQADVDSDFVETREQLALVSGTPTAIPGKSRRTVLTSDPRGNRIQEESFIYDGSGWEAISTTEFEYSAELIKGGFQLLKRSKDGRVLLEQSWSGPLVTGRTDESGLQTSYFYDALDRLELEIKSGYGGRADIVTEYDRSLGAIDCGCDGQSLVTRSAGGLELTSHKKTDAAGRHSEILDENGYTTTYTYQNGGRITTETQPDGSTRITENYLDGRFKSITGTGVIPEYYSYGVNTDGTTWTRVDVAAATSPRYRKTTFDVAGRMVLEESPAFTSGNVQREMFYNDRGLLAKTAETGKADTLYEYDPLANLVRSGLDIDDNGSLDLASADRITDTETVHEQDGAGDWFAVSTTTVYPETGSATAIDVAVTKRRLSGFTTDATLGDLASEQISIDVHDNETVRETWIDRDAKIVTRVTNTPGSDINAVSTTVNGLLLAQNSSTVVEPTTFDYDALERRISVKEPRHQNAATTDYYTGTRQIFTETDADGNTTAFEYYDNGETGAGQVKTVTDALLQKSYFAYDDLGRQTRTWGETDYPQAYSYNAYGELATLTTYRDASDSIDFTTASWPSPSGGDTTTWTYDAATGLLTRKEYADEEGTDCKRHAKHRD